MKEKLKIPKVEGIAIAITKEKNQLNEYDYNVYLINKKQEKLEQVIVVSRGYIVNSENNEEKKTSVFRTLLGEVEPKSAIKIEPIMEELLSLHNEYWVSFWVDEILYDKKFIFLAESLTDEHLVPLPFLESKGLLIGL